MIRAAPEDTDSHGGRDTRALTLALPSMRTDHPLTLTSSRPANALGVGRSTALRARPIRRLARSALRRRIVVSISHVAERPCVTPADVWVVLSAEKPSRLSGPPGAERSNNCWRRRPNPYISEPLTLS